LANWSARRDRIGARSSNQGDDEGTVTGNAGIRENAATSREAPWRVSSEMRQPQDQPARSINPRVFHRFTETVKDPTLLF
jgi:hypothetical protein